MKLKGEKSNQITTILLYISGFFLFLEWLYPLGDITDTTVGVFVMFAIYCFFLSLFEMKWWLTLLLKGFALMFILNGLYFDVSLVELQWITNAVEELFYNINILFSQEWYFLTPMFRSLLFLILIWLMSYLLHYWFVQMKHIFLFILLTFFYVTIIDTFTVYDGAFSVVRTFIISFVALGIANLGKEIDKGSVRITIKNSVVYWLMPLMGLVLFSSMIGYAAPKLDPQWPDPVPFIQSAAENAGYGSGPVQKVGYGENDSQLGGSFIQDDTPVFEATSEEDHYWRIETKDLYTGKGWETSLDSTEMESPNGMIPFATFSNNVELEDLEAEIEFVGGESLPKLVYPYGANQVTAENDYEIFHDVSMEAVFMKENGEDVEPNQYQIQYNHPSYDIDVLKEDDGDDGEAIQERFTQLPDELPERVGELAEEITGSQETRYDKAKAIERYFSSNDYQYQTTDIPVPGDGEDYVDQFLFDTKVGYCDNFSTSMVVLLRSLDIPARWVKGFTSGEIMDTLDDDKRIYEVKNSNAHSWVEVYFPETGWVPFEPTQGFTNLSDFHVELEENNENEQDYLEAPENNTQEPPESESEEPEEEEDTLATGSSTNDDGLTINSWYIWIGIAVLVLIIAIVLFKRRHHVKVRIIQAKLEKQQDTASFQDAYLYLITLLKKQGYQRHPDQTLREFAKEVDFNLSSQDMGELTRHYERTIYSGNNSLRIQELTQLWKNLINRIMG
ncbi:MULTISPECIES: transglutaminase domain-containing protein [unclassified Oceanobacillus]|uniref:DUF4129 domain-containing transglutaminase family protein n=1 Tax=unclassified Oceanobacillus TaxID=2630292 RepID=UPI001BEA9007|nr:MULTISPECIES: transglutaminase domain-containing protein [unclassified Oceanobacillus]MBT2600601.1 DUF4129 domain-containing protein [Oceanobacillus sp. ISL-74]MBT2651002.1 DUF4129 domain-containing protein [Oceanobacillus sp. ISL-73]